MKSIRDEPEETALDKFAKVWGFVTTAAAGAAAGAAAVGEFAAGFGKTGREQGDADEGATKSV